jgi:hypothetical protein
MSEVLIIGSQQGDAQLNPRICVCVRQLAKFEKSLTQLGERPGASGEIDRTSGAVEAGELALVEREARKS